MTNILFYDDVTLLGKSTASVPEASLKNFTDPYVIVEDDVIEPHAWIVDPITMTASFVGRAIESEEVSIERDLRIHEGFFFKGWKFQCDDVSKQNISGAASLAGFAMMQGAQVGNYRWNGGETDFVWFDVDNVPRLMDASDMLAMGGAAAEHVRVHITAARVLKDAPNGIPADYQDDVHWP